MENNFILFLVAAGLLAAIYFYRQSGGSVISFNSPVVTVKNTDAPLGNAAFVDGESEARALKHGGGSGAGNTNAVVDTFESQIKHDSGSASQKFDPSSAVTAGVRGKTHNAGGVEMHAM